MKYFYFIFLLFPFFITCKKENTETVYVNSITLNELIISEDSITLNWTALNSPYFLYYGILRFEGIDTVYLEGVNNVKNTFIDKNVPYSPNVSYQIIGYNVIPNSNSKEKIKSNIVKYTRPEIQTLQGSPTQIKYDETNNQLYLFEAKGKISIHDIISGKTIKSVNLNASIGECDLGSYNGVKEIYIPRNDGWIYILNAQTLEQIDQINVKYEAGSVIFSNNFLFIIIPSLNSKPLKVYKRATKNLVNEVGSRSILNLKKLPNSNNDFFEISYAQSITGIYNFDSSGQQILFTPIFTSEKKIESPIFEFFPKGDKFISTNKGSIFSNECVFITDLIKDENPYTAFVFNPLNMQFYGAKANKTVEVYSEILYKYLRTIKTNSYIVKLFKTPENKIFGIGLSKGFDEDYPEAPERFVIEQIQ